MSEPILPPEGKNRVYDENGFTINSPD